MGIGYVNFTIYYGTYYDRINIPWSPAQIVDEATMTKEFKGYYVWQTTWLSAIRVNLEKDYQDLVGAQYVQMTDAGADFYGNHWYNVIGYQNLSAQSAEIYLEYNPYLTLPFAMMDSYHWGVSGMMQRWTVDDDSTWKWVHTPEPLDLAAPMVYTYKRIDPTGAGITPVAGFPYQMSAKPTVETYGDSNIYYPNWKSAIETPFTIKSEYSTRESSDGLAYYKWKSGTTIYDNYNIAMGLGMDVVCQGYKLPDTDLIPELAGQGDGIRFQSLTGIFKKYPVSLSLADGGYNNAKTGYSNIYFTLYNEASGDSVTVNGFELSNMSVVIGANPYVTGGLWARFDTYLTDNQGDTGVVKSPPWEALTISSTVNYNASTNMLAIYAAKDILSTQYLQTRDSLNTGYNQTVRTLDTQNDIGNRNIGGGYAQSLISAILGAVTAGVSGNTGGIVNPIGGIINATIGAGVSGTNQIDEQNLARENAMESFHLAQQQSMEMFNKQAAILSYQGNLGSCQPPVIKYAQSGGYNANTFTFGVRKATPAFSDRSRIDKFFTAYGYNVNGYPLTSIKQLACREKFTFVQVENFKFIPYNSETNKEQGDRVMDEMTQQYFTNMMSRGVRIWKSKPDFDYSKRNRIIS